MILIFGLTASTYAIQLINNSNILYTCCCCLNILFCSVYANSCIVYRWCWKSYMLFLCLLRRHMNGETPGNFYVHIFWWMNMENSFINVCVVFFSRFSAYDCTFMKKYVQKLCQTYTQDTDLYDTYDVSFIISREWFCVFYQNDVIVLTIFLWRFGLIFAQSLNEKW